MYLCVDYKIEILSYFYSLVFCRAMCFCISYIHYNVVYVLAIEKVIMCFFCSCVVCRVICFCISCIHNHFVYVLTIRKNYVFLILYFVGFFIILVFCRVMFFCRSYFHYNFFFSMYCPQDSVFVGPYFTGWKASKYFCNLCLVPYQSLEPELVFLLLPAHFPQLFILNFVVKTDCDRQVIKF